MSSAWQDQDSIQEQWWEYVRSLMEKAKKDAFKDADGWLSDYPRVKALQYCLDNKLIDDLDVFADELKDLNNLDRDKKIEELAGAKHTYALALWNIAAAAIEALAYEEEKEHLEALPSFWDDSHRLLRREPSSDVERVTVLQPNTKRALIKKDSGSDQDPICDDKTTYSFLWEPISLEGIETIARLKGSGDLLIDSGRFHKLTLRTLLYSYKIRSKETKTHTQTNIYTQKFTSTHTHRPISIHRSIPPH